MPILSWPLLYLISEWAVRLIMLVYVPHRRSPAAARTWLLLIFLIPWPGLALYAIFGRIYLPKRRVEMQMRASEQIRAAQAQMKANVPWNFPALPPDFKQFRQLAARLGDFEPMGGNRIELLCDYAGSIDRLIEDIDQARYQVHLLFYIFADDATGGRVAEAMVRAEKRGVNCRLLLDAVGAGKAFRRIVPLMRSQGIEVIEMLPVGLLRARAARFDLRNHRKIAVIDGHVGYTGSQNIVEPYFVPGHPNHELMVRVTGPIVAQLQAVFLADRYFETESVLDEPALFPNLAPTGTSAAQLLPSGPGYQRENAHELMVALVHGAEERVVMATPYFIVDQPFLQAMRTAVLRGVEVHLVVSEKLDQVVIGLAQKSFYEELLEAGVQLHLYQPGFLHAKHISVDDDVAIIGSTNIDIRSFSLNAELSMLVYDKNVVAELRAVEERYFANSRLLTAQEWARRPWIVRTLQGIARLADTVL